MKHNNIEVVSLPVEFRVSSDPRLLKQYYALRQRCFRAELGLPDFDGSQEPADRQGQVLLALYDGQCIGGARVSPQVTWSSQAQALGLQRGQCCMWERFAVEPRLRTPSLLRDFCAALVGASRDAGFGYAMVLSSMRNARLYRRCHSALGVPYQIHRPVPYCVTGAFAGLEHYLSVADLRQPTALDIAV